MKGHRTAAIGLAALFALLPPAAASPDTRGVLELRGIPAGNSVQLTLTPKRPMTAVRIYSEPSHTYLLLVIDPVFQKSREGRAWLKASAKGQSPRGTVTTKLPEGRPSVEVPAPPPGDDSVSVWVLGTWEAGKKEDHVFRSGKLDPAGYVMTIDLMDAPRAKP